MAMDPSNDMSNGNVPDMPTSSEQPAPGGGSPLPSKNRSKSHRKLALPVIITFFAIVSIVISIGLVTGRVYFGIKNNDQVVHFTDKQARIVTVKDNQQVVVRTVACDQNIIGQHSAGNYPTSDEGIALLKQIESKKDWQDDPTCQAIMFWRAWRVDDKDGAKKAADALSKLHDRGLFPDNNLINTFALPHATSIAIGLSQEGDNEGEQ